LAQQWNPDDETRVMILDMDLSTVPIGLPEIIIVVVVGFLGYVSYRRLRKT
jgi:hypothetical protein